MPKMVIRKVSGNESVLSSANRAQNVWSSPRLRSEEMRDYADACWLRAGYR
jgi:hypothetical protein